MLKGRTLGPVLPFIADSDTVLSPIVTTRLVDGVATSMKSTRVQPESSMSGPGAAETAAALDRLKRKACQHASTAAMHEAVALANNLTPHQKIMLYSCWLVPLARLRQLHRLLFVADKVGGLFVLTLVSLAPLLHSLAMDHALADADPAFARTLSTWTKAVASSAALAHAAFLMLHLSRMSTSAGHLADTMEKLGRGAMATLHKTQPDAVAPFLEDFLQQIEGAMHAGGGFNRMLSGDVAAVKAKYAATEQAVEDDIEKIDS